MADNPSPDEQERRYREREQDGAEGMVLMSGDEVVWSGPKAVLGQELQEDEAGDDGEESVATGEDYTPPDDEPSGE